MPYANHAEKIVNNRERYERDGAKMRKDAKELYWSKQPEIRERRKQLRGPEERKLDTAAMKRRHKALRAEMLAAYGGCCACCSEDEPFFLDLDHSGNNGHEHRRRIGRGSGVVYRYLKKLGWPKDGYQLFCSNCNAGKARNGGVCPHVGHPHHI